MDRVEWTWSMSRLLEIDHLGAALFNHPLAHSLIGSGSGRSLVHTEERQLLHSSFKEID